MLPSSLSLRRFTPLSSLLSRISTNTFCTTYHPPPLPALSPLLPPPSPSLTSSLSSSFSQWFLSHPPNSPQHLLNRIYSLLASSSDETSLHESLSSLHLPLSETFLLSFLNHKPFLNTNIKDPNQLLLLRLRFFDWSGRQANYNHSRVVYHSLFRILKNSKKSPLILQWVKLFSNAPNPHPRFHDTLIIAYSIADKPELALRVLGKMRFSGLNPDPFSTKVLLNSLVDNSLFSYFDSIFPTFPSKDPVAISIKLKSLCARGELYSAENMIRSLPKQIASRGFIAGVLIKSLCKKDNFAKALKITEEFSSAEVYTVYLSCLISSNRLYQALKFLSYKKTSEDYIPDAYLYNKLINCLLRKNLLGPAYDSLTQMMEEGMPPTSAMMSSSLRFFCKAGLVETALHLYKSRGELGIDPNGSVFDDLIRALCSQGDTERACQVLEDSIERGYFPGRKAFATLAKVLCREGKLDRVRTLLDAAVKREVKPSTDVLARYLTALCNVGNLEEACLVPYMVPETTGTGTIYKYKSTYISLIQAFSYLKRVDMLPKLFLEMQEMGHSPSRSLYRLVVSTLCENEKFEDVLRLLDLQLERNEFDERTCYNYFIEGAFSAKKPDMGREVYNRMESKGLKPNLDTNILLLQGYLKSNKISDALTFFEFLREKKEPSNKLYNSIITGLCKAGRPDLAINFYREARGKKLIPSLECYEELSLALGKVKDYTTLVKVIEDFRETGRPVSAFLCNVLLLHTLRSRDLFKAWFAFKEKENDQKSGTSIKQTTGRQLLGQLIAAFSGGIRLTNNAINIEEELEKHFPMDIHTYNMLLRGFSMGGRMDLARQLFDRMCKKGYNPNRWSFDIMVHGYCREGERDEAQRWIEAMWRHGFVPTRYTLKLFS